MYILRTVTQYSPNLRNITFLLTRCGHSSIHRYSSSCLVSTPHPSVSLFSLSFLESTGFSTCVDIRTAVHRHSAQRLYSEMAYYPSACDSHPSHQPANDPRVSNDSQKSMSPEAVLLRKEDWRGRNEGLGEMTQSFCGFPDVSTSVPQKHSP